MKKVNRIFIYLFIILSIIFVFFYKREVTDDIENNDSIEESSSDSNIYNDWNKDTYSMNESEIENKFNDAIKSREKNTVVVFYDGGECNPYINTVLDSLNEISDNYQKLLVTNFKQSHADIKYNNNLDMFVIGDENRFLAKKLNLYDSESQRMKNVIMTYSDGELVSMNEYSPRSKIEIINHIDGK